MVFPMRIYGNKSWTLKKQDGNRIDTFEFWLWGILLGIKRDPENKQMDY